MSPEPELIIGWEAIARFAGLTVEEAQRRADLGELPIHKVGAADSVEVAATPTGLRQCAMGRPR